MGVPVLYAGSQYYPGIPPSKQYPAFSAAEVGNVNASTVAVTFSVNVSASDYAAGVTIKVNGSSATISSATRQSNHALVYYVLSAAVVNGDTVTWEYSGGNIVNEATGAGLQAVSAQSVTNNVAPSGPVALLDFRAETGVTTSTAGYSGTGTITQSGTTISGTGTLFQLEVVVGDQISASGISGIVQSIASDTELVLDTSATVGVGVVYTITPQAGTARVTEWANQGTLGGKFTQSAETARPSQQTISGTKYVRLDGFNDWMLGDALWSTPLNNPDTFTAYFILKSSLTVGHIRDCAR